MRAPLVSGDEPGEALARLVHRAALHELPDFDRQPRVLGRSGQARAGAARAGAAAGTGAAASGLARRTAWSLIKDYGLRPQTCLQSNSSRAPIC